MRSSNGTSPRELRRYNLPKTSVHVARESLSLNYPFLAVLINGIDDQRKELMLDENGFERGLGFVLHQGLKLYGD